MRPHPMWTNAGAGVRELVIRNDRDDGLVRLCPYGYNLKSEAAYERFILDEFCQEGFEGHAR
jgi:aromatic ring-opening dioxygenase LigB subunit